MKPLKQLFILLLILSSSNICLAEKTDYKIAAGSILESYFSIGLKVCRFFKQSNPGTTCDVVPTSGSIESIELLKKGEVDFAFAQSNIALDAYKAGGYYMHKPPMDNIRQVLRLHDEYFTVIVKDNDKLLVFGDIDGKKISNGPPLSDSSATYGLLKNYYNFMVDPHDIEISYEHYAKKFCGGKVDAIFIMTGHPNALVNHITHRCDTEFIKIEDHQLDKILKDKRVFRRGVIKASMYPNISAEHDTIVVESLLITTDAIDKKKVSNMIELLEKQINVFKSSHPVLYDLDDIHFSTGFIFPSYKLEEKQSNLTTDEKKKEE